MKKKFTALFLAATMLLVACGGGSGTKAGGGALTVGFTTTNDGIFSPVFYKSSYDGWVVDLVFERLYYFNENNELVDYLADGMPEVSADGTEYTVKLRDSKFSDGEAVTADDVVFTYSILADGKYTGRFSPNVQDMVGYKEYNDGTDAEFKGVTKVDDKTVKFKFTEEKRVNIESLTVGIMPEHYYAPGYKNGDAGEIEAKMNAPIGSGPYTLDKFDPAVAVVLKKNAEYTGEGYDVESVIIKPLTQSTDIQSLEKGEINLLPGVIEPTKVKTGHTSESLAANTYDRSGYGYITFNNEATSTKHKEVRQALAYGFNVQGFVDSYFESAEEGGEPLAIRPKNIYNPISWVNEGLKDGDIPTYDFDLEKANAILDEAGWVKGSDGIRVKDGEILEVKVLAMPEHDILDTLVPMWKKEWGEGMGIKVTVNTLDFNVISNMITDDEQINDWSLFFMAVSFTSDDPDSVYSSYHSKFAGNGLDNYPRLRNPQLDALMEEARTLPKEEARPLYVEIGKILQDEMPTVPVYANTYNDLYSTKVKGLKTNSLYQWTYGLKDVTIEK